MCQIISVPHVKVKIFALLCSLKSKQIKDCILTCSPSLYLPYESHMAEKIPP